jgi:ParB/RepB/Spo0J family partition protein
MAAPAAPRARGGAVAGELRDVPLSAIDPSPLNPRKTFDAAGLMDLAESLKRDGLLQPIILRPEGKHYVIVAGERRYRAAEIAGWATIPAIVQLPMDDAEHLRKALIENLQRADLNPIEIAHAYQQLHDDHGMTQGQIAELAGRGNQASVSNDLRLLELPPAVQERIERGELDRAKGVALASFKNFPQLAEQIAADAVRHHWTSKHLEGADSTLAAHGREWEDRGLLTRLAGAHFDVAKTCAEACPFGAYRAPEKLSFSAVCLRPEHFAELEKDAREKRQQEAQQQREQVLASGREIIDLATLPSWAYQRISRPVPGCSPETCACWRTAQGRPDGPFFQLVDVCLDPRRRHELEKADEATRGAAAAAKAAADLEQLYAHLDSLTEITSRELAELVYDQLGASGETVTAAARRYGTPELAELLRSSFDPHSTALGRHEQLLAELEKLSPLQLARFALAKLIGRELADQAAHYANPAWGTPRAMRYLGIGTEPQPLVDRGAGKPAGWDIELDCCDVCGCTEQDGCRDGCAWERGGLCSSCAHALDGASPETLAAFTGNPPLGYQARQELRSVKPELPVLRVRLSDGEPLAAVRLAFTAAARSLGGRVDFQEEMPFVTDDDRPQLQVRFIAGAHDPAIGSPPVGSLLPQDSGQDAGPAAAVAHTAAAPAPAPAEPAPAAAAPHRKGRGPLDGDLFKEARGVRFKKASRRSAHTASDHAWLIQRGPYAGWWIGQGPDAKLYDGADHPSSNPPKDVRGSAAGIKRWVAEQTAAAEQVAG